MLAAPQSGSGKTTLTLGLLRALKNTGTDICAAKAGPDYIDPGFHALAGGRASVNLDPWAMTGKRISSLAFLQTGTHLLIEAMMGLFDGAADGSGTAADLAKCLNVPVVLIVDAASQSHSVAALVRGFRDHDPALKFAGVLFNKVGSPRHEAMLRDALATVDVPVLGAIPRNQSLALPERHLGLVQAGEQTGIEAFIENAAGIISGNCDLEAITGCFKPCASDGEISGQLPAPGQHIAIARDEAFSFIYPHLLQDWRRQGAGLSFFSPLADQGPNDSADAVYLPGGYPELHAGRLSSANGFKTGMLAAVERGALVYGECGGYMVLGEGLVDAEGVKHEMLGLLKLETSFAKRKLHLGYRNLSAANFVLGRKLKAHEFHYTTAVKEAGEPLFQSEDALGENTGDAGLRNDTVMGSYMHVIDCGENHA